MLKLQLKNCVARGRLLKIKGSYKLSRREQKLAEVKKPAAAGMGKKPEASDAAVRKHKGKASARQKNKAPAAGFNLSATAEAKSAKTTMDKKASEAAAA